MASSKPDFPPVRACLFDMDGLLLNTEDLYTIVTNQILHKYGKPDLPWSIKAQLQGRPYPQATRIFQGWAQLPVSAEEYQAEAAALQRELFPTCSPLPGAASLLSNLHAAGIELALATSSQKKNFFLKTDHLTDFMSSFPQERRVLGDDPRVPAGKGKPAPYIYMVALETINEDLRKQGKKEIQVDECLVFEDAVPGVEAGRRAGMRVVWCPHPDLRKMYEGTEEDVLAGLIGGGTENEGGAEKPQAAPENVLAGWPGQKRDGWAETLRSLEDFEYEKYGIQIPVKAKA